MTRQPKVIATGKVNELAIAQAHVSAVDLLERFGLSHLVYSSLSGPFQNLSKLALDGFDFNPIGFLLGGYWPRLPDSGVGFGGLRGAHNRRQTLLVPRNFWHLVVGSLRRLAG